ncbi:MAG: hypothetical protein AB7N80_13655 [Bdellovibrionales bacterium]
MASPWAYAEVMFEGYSIIRSGTTPIGYTIQRYEFDAKKKQFTATSFLKTNATGGDLTESLKAVANDKFQPVSYQYVTKTGDKAKMIDAKFAKDKMTGTRTDGKTPHPISVAVKKGTFLSTFLGYLMLQNGLKAEKKFVYSAIAEEDGAAYSGEALIKNEEDYRGQKAYRVVNNFKGTEFISFVTAKGEVLGTTSPLQNISTELVANPAEATKGFILPNDTLKILFGAVPTGKVNVLASKLTILQGDAPTVAPQPSTPSPKHPTTKVPFTPAPKVPDPKPSTAEGSTVK